MWQKNYCVTCYNNEPSLTIIMDDGNHILKKKNSMFKFFHSATCQIIIDG